jgi:rare lipoprotein A
VRRFGPIRHFWHTRHFWLAALALAACAAALPAEEGLASWYGGKFHGRRTASGEIFDTRQLTAAHRSLPFGTWVLVTNLENGKSVTVRINDRGPFVEGRVIDLSLAAAAAIGLTGKGVVPVRLQVLERHEAVSYCLQLGSFRRRANAESLRSRLRVAGFPAELQAAEGGATRVVLRRVPSSELPALRARLSAAGWAEALVRVEP